MGAASYISCTKYSLMAALIHMTGRSYIFKHGISLCNCPSMIIAKLSDCKLLGDSNTYINQDGTGCLHPCVLNFDVKCNVEVGDSSNKRQYDTSYPYHGKLKSVHSAKKQTKKNTIDNTTFILHFV